MGKKVPWKDIPDTALVPADIYGVTVKSLDEAMTKGSEEAQPKLVYVAQLKITEPKEYAGMVLFDRFVVGTEDDPTGDDPETWKGSFAARRLKQFVAATGTPLGADMTDTMEAIEGKEALAMVSLDGKRTDAKTGRTYDESNSVKTYYKVGTMAAGSGKGGRPAAPTSRPAAPKAAPAGNGSAETTKAPAKGKSAKAEMTKCPVCDADVLRTEFIGHVNTHEGEEATE